MGNNEGIMIGTRVKIHGFPEYNGVTGRITAAGTGCFVGSYRVKFDTGWEDLAYSNSYWDRGYLQEVEEEETIEGEEIEQKDW